MKLLRLFFLVLASFLSLLTGESKIDEKIDRLKEVALDEQGFEKVRTIHRNWYLFSVKALLAQMSKEFLATARSESAEMLRNCLKRIRESKDLTRTARCLIKAKKLEEKLPHLANSPTLSGLALRQEPRERRHWLKNVVRLDLRRLKRKLKPEAEDLFDRRSLRLKRSPHRLIASAILKSDSEIFEVNQQNVAPPLLEGTASSPAKKLSSLFVSLFSKISTSELPRKWSTTYKKMLELQRKLEENEKLPGARIYDAPIYDIVTDAHRTTKHGSKEVPFIPPFLKNVVGIVNSFSGADNARILSPRLAPLMPDKAKSRGLLSPAVFPFYRDDSEQQILPIPKILEDSGLNEKDRESVLEMIMEVSGARETVDNAMKVLDHLSSFGLGEELLNASEKIGESFERLRASFHDAQKKELDRRGFTFMEAEQMRKLYKDQGLNEQKIEEEVEHYAALSQSERMEALWETVVNIAAPRKRRMKRQDLPISILQPVVLSPFQFAPVFGISILGPVVLSPNIFSPLILNPAVLGPWVLSPSIPLPFIISPYLLSPYVLSPLVMAPFILNPYVLSPNVINPYVLSPLILSPLVLCPDVISPMTLGGAVLSPSVLSPAVLSKSYLMVAVLSPSVLS